MTYTLHSSVRGTSHRLTGLPCQDASSTYDNASRSIVMAAVSDGHGSCPRSDLGAWLACEVAISCMRSWVEQNPHTLAAEAQDSSMRQLFASIVVEWQRGIAYDLGLTAAELTPEQLHDYGCTLIGYLQTPEYWIGFQIGDGKLLVKVPAANRREWQQPVPWDDDCISNLTTSLCSSHAIDRFRHYYSTAAAPGAIFLGSDGLDDTFGDGAGLERFYDHVLDSIVTDGLTTVGRQMPQVLSHYSQVGSHDDMSIALILNL